MCTVLLPPGVNPIAVFNYIISYITKRCPSVALCSPPISLGLTWDGT